MSENDNNLNEKLTNLCDARGKASKELSEMERAIEGARMKLIEDIADGHDGIKQNEAIEKLEGKRDRHFRYVQELSRQIEVVKEAVHEREMAQFYADLALLTEPATEKMADIAKCIEELYKLSCEYLALEHAINIKHPPKENWRGLKAQVMPVQSIKQKADIWLGKKGFGPNHMSMFTSELGIMDEADRLAYYREEIENARKAIGSMA